MRRTMIVQLTGMHLSREQLALQRYGYRQLEPVSIGDVPEDWALVPRLHDILMDADRTDA